MTVDVGPLFGLRLRTPRLELRLPTHEELVELREVARAGVHPPEEMPFAYAWTDEPYAEDWVVAFHEGRRAAWRPETWDLELGVWTEGAPAGIQGIVAKDFAGTRAVATGSWLGQRFQGRGYGPEMRTAVLELAFRGLGAEVARPERSTATSARYASRRSSATARSAVRRSRRAASRSARPTSSCDGTSGARRSRSRSKASRPVCRCPASRSRDARVAQVPGTFATSV